MTDPHTRNIGIAFGTLLASSTTLVCCVVPSVLVSIGAGAALVGLVSAVPQLVWLSEHKALVFGLAGVLLAVSGFVLWRARSAPCPSDPILARSCARMRRASHTLYLLSFAFFLLGVGFAFVLPMLAR